MTETTSTETVQATETTTETAPAKNDTGMVGVQPDRELGTEASEDTPSESLDAPLFDEVAPSEAELMGEEPEKEETKPAPEEKVAEGDKKVTDKKPEGEKPEGEAVAEEKEGEDKKEEPEAKDEKPPAGYVPHAALHEARMEKQELARELNALKQEVADLKATKEEVAEDSFKVLSDEEFEELVEEDPVEAIKYERKLDKYREAQKSKENERDVAKKQQEKDQQVITESLERMTKAVPGLYEEGSSVNKDLATFAIKNGFDPDLLGLMTTPSTFIATPNGDIKPLGNGAAGLVEMIYKFYTAAKTNSPETLRAQAEANAEKKLRETITAELMKKFKTQKGTDFKSIGDVPGASGETPEITGGFTEAQYVNMTPQQRDKLLGA